MTVFGVATPKRRSLLAAIGGMVLLIIASSALPQTTAADDPPAERFTSREVPPEEKAIDDLLPPLTKALEATPGFAGLYLDGTTLHISSAGDLTALPSLVALHNSKNVAVVIEGADYSLQTLNDVHTAVTRDSDALRARGILLTRWGANPRTNRLELHIVGLTDDIRKELVDRYGPAASPVAGEEYSSLHCVTRAHCHSPWRAGLYINSAATGNYCTSGFVARDIPYAGAWYLMTAGHCFTAGGGLGVNWNHYQSGTIGSASSNFDQPGTKVDVGYIVFPSYQVPGNVLYGSQSEDQRAMGGWKLNSQQIVGTTACRSGYASDYDCGQISATNQSLYFSGFGYRHGQWILNFVSATGDSGAPVLNDWNLGYGITSSGSSTTTAYGTLENIYDLTGKTICTTSTC